MAEIKNRRESESETCLQKPKPAKQYLALALIAQSNLQWVNKSLTTKTACWRRYDRLISLKLLLQSEI